MSAQWRSRPEGGGRLAIWLLRATALRCGRRFMHVLSGPITVYFFLRRGPERRASLQFLTRALGRPATWADAFHHLRFFGKTQLDRIFLLARGEQGFDIQSEGVEQLESCVARGRGVLLIGSHQGSFEALRALSARRPDLNLRVVLDKQKTPAMTELLEALAPEIGAAVIDASRGGASLTLATAEACQNGAMVALLADRGRDSEIFRDVTFLGAPAPLPTGPWLLAHALKVPVMLCFGLYEGGNRYRLIFEPFADEIDIPRQGRERALDGYLRRYAARLEHYALTSPYNWFNFHDFWHGALTTRELDTVVGEQVDA